MHICYIYSTIPRKTLPFLEYYKTSQTGKFRNRSQSSGQGWMLYILHAEVFHPSTVRMFSPRQTLAAGLFFLVFSQLISPAAGIFFGIDFKTISLLIWIRGSCANVPRVVGACTKSKDFIVVKIDMLPWIELRSFVEHQNSHFVFFNNLLRRRHSLWFSFYRPG